MSGFLDTRAHAAAIKTAIDATVGPIPNTTDTRTYDYDQVPGVNGNDGTQPNIYVVVSLERRHNPNLRANAQAGLTGWRAAVRANGRDVDEVRWGLLKVAEALNEVSLTVNGTRTTPMQFESDEAPQYDDHRYTAVAFYTYAH